MTESMQHNTAGYMACEALVAIARALTQLEVGELAIVKFGETTQLLHPFDRPFTDEAGAEVTVFSFTWVAYSSSSLFVVCSACLSAA